MTMTHGQALEMMMAELDGLLSPTEAVYLEQHVEFCPECREEWNALQLVDGLLASAPAIAAPAGFAQRVQARIEVPSWTRTLGALYALGLGSILALLVIAVPAAAVLLGIWYVYNEPAGFASVMVWLSQLVRVSGALLEAVWTTVRLFVADLATKPVTLGWALMAAVVTAAWARALRKPDFVHVNGG